MKNEGLYRTTTFQISHHMHTQLKTMCMLTKKSMGEFIRICIAEKIKQLKNQETK